MVNNISLDNNIKILYKGTYMYTFSNLLVKKFKTYILFKQNN